MALSNIKQKKQEAAAAAAAKHDNTPPPPPPAAAPDQEEADYSFVKVTKDQYGNFRGCNIQQTGFIALLMRLGYRRYDKTDGTFVVVKITTNIIEEITIPNLRVAVVRYFRNLDASELEAHTDCPHMELLEKLYRSLGTLLSEEKLSLLVDASENIARAIVQDTKDQAFYFYENGFVEISKAGGILLKPYDKLPGLVWKDQILPRTFAPIADMEEIAKGDFYRFCHNVAGKNAERLSALQSIAGYNLHRFFQTHLWATILLDARTSDEPDGRSGKSLFCKALRYMLNSDPENGAQCRIIDGKTFLVDNRFKYEELRHNTRLFILDDVKRGINIEEFFNAIPDGISVERKSTQGKERVHTKIVFTLNYTISIRGGSAKDRVLEFEFADYYSSKFKPEHEFKRWFFRDWDAAEWNRFDNFMLSCVDLFMRVGVVQTQTINLDARKLKDETCQEFINSMEDLAVEHCKRYSKRELYRKFVDMGDDGKARNKDFHWLKQRQFSKWLTLWAEYRPEMAGYRTERPGGEDCIRFFYNTGVDAPLLEEGKNATVVLFPEKSEHVKPVPVEASGEAKSDTTANEDEKIPF